MGIFSSLTEPGLAFAIAMLPLAIWMVIARPAAWPIIFLCFSAFRLPDAFPIIRPLNLTFFGGFFALFTLVWHGLLARNLKPSWRPELIAMLALFVVALISAIFPLSREAAMEALTGSYWKIIATTLALAFLLRTVEDFRTLIGAIISCGVLLSLVAFYNKFHGIDLVEETRVGIGLEFKSPIADPNDLALVLLAPLSCSLAFLVQRREWLTTLSMAIVSSMILYAIILTQGRGAILGVLAVVGVIGMSFVRSRVLLAVIAIIAGLALFAVMGIAARRSGGFADIAEGGGIDASSYLRILAWQAAINMTIARPLTGVGIGSFSNAFYLYTAVWPGIAMTPHSSWFGVVAETGIPGLVAFVAMIALALRALSGAAARMRTADTPDFMKSSALGVKASIVGFIVGGSFLGQQFTWTVYTLVALASAMSAYASRLAPTVATHTQSQPFSTRPPDRSRSPGGAYARQTAAS